jgi:hypothetical protein
MGKTLRTQLIHNGDILPNIVVFKMLHGMEQFRNAKLTRRPKIVRRLQPQNVRNHES